MDLDPRILLFVLGGLGLIGVVALAKPLKRLPLSIPMLYVALGWAAFALPLGLPHLDPVGDEVHTRLMEYLTEFIVVISLAGAGLAIDRPFRLRHWGDVWPLLGVTMPLSIAAVALLGWGWLGLTPAAALLLAAALSPTDPVLAKSVQVGPPHTAEERDDVRFSLTVEAGLNDGLAFPFTYLAVAAVGQTALGAWTWQWFGFDVVYRIVVGVLIGMAVGWAVARYVFERTEEARAAERDDRSLPTNEGLVVMASIFLAYGVAEVIGGYGFLAVFVCAVAARQIERDSAYHTRTHQFVNQLEEVMLVGMLIGFGGLLASGILDALTLPAALVGVLFILVIRPATGLLATIRDEVPLPGRLAIAFLGIRGIGTIYYLAYGQDHADFTADLDLVWATACFAILVSLVVHGVTAAPIMRWLDRHHAKADPDASTPDDWEAEEAADAAS